MKTWIWILLGATVIIGYFLWINRESMGFVKKIIAITSSPPNEFIRNSIGVNGTTKWYKLDGKYYSVASFGMMAGIPQETTKELFIEAWKS